MKEGSVKWRLTTDMLHHFIMRRGLLREVHERGREGGGGGRERERKREEEVVYELGEGGGCKEILQGIVLEGSEHSKKMTMCGCVWGGVMGSVWAWVWMI